MRAFLIGIFLFKILSHLCLFFRAFRKEIYIISNRLNIVNLQTRKISREIWAHLWKILIRRFAEIILHKNHIECLNAYWWWLRVCRAKCPNLGIFNVLAATILYTAGVKWSEPSLLVAFEYHQADSLAGSSRSSLEQKYVFFSIYLKKTRKQENKKTLEPNELARMEFCALISFARAFLSW